MTVAAIVKRAKTALINALDLRDAFVFSGMGCVAYGLAQIYAPAAWVAAGAALFWLGVRR